MWNEGYVSEIDYTHGYYAELSPVRLRLALLARGIAHTISSAPNYLELGFGQGLTLAINAASCCGEYYGTDFNPSHAAAAQGLASASGRNVRILDDSFEQLLARRDLPEFDIIALHGIWSWVSNESRAAIVELARTRLKPGGIFYISYNVTPGWSPVVPMRHLLTEYVKRSATGTIVSRIDQSLNFADRVVKAGARYFADNPSLAQRLESIKGQNRNYLAHEYFNQHWVPMSFVEISDVLAEAKLTFGASANVLDNLEGLSIPFPAREILDEISDVALREMTRDYFIGQQFRRDIFVKGSRPLTKGELRHEIQQVEFVLVGNPANRPQRVATSAGTAELRAEIYDAIAAVVETDPDRAISLATLLKTSRCAALNEWQLWEALLVLSATGWLAPKQADANIAEVRESTLKFNRALIERATYASQIHFLACAATGTGFPVGRIEQLMLGAWMNGHEYPPQFAAEHLASAGELLVAEGAAVQDSAKTREMLETAWKELETLKIPILRRTGALA